MSQEFGGVAIVEAGDEFQNETETVEIKRMYVDDDGETRVTTCHVHRSGEVDVDDMSLMAFCHYYTENDLMLVHYE